LIQQHGEELTVGVLDEMHYTEAVIKEVLRVAPPSGLVMRKTQVDMEVRETRGGGRYFRGGGVL
jgi:cytochrome P450